MMKTIYCGFAEILTTDLGYQAYEGLLHELEAANDKGIDWSSEGLHPITGAILGGHTECVAFLLKCGSPISSKLMTQALSRNKDLYEKNFLDPKFNCYLTPMVATENLVLACRAPSLKLCLFFLDHGADPNGVVDCGLPPIHWAAQNFDKDVLEILLKHGADVNSQVAIDGEKYSTLRSLAASGYKINNPSLRKEIYDFLISKGAKAIPIFKSEEELIVKAGGVVVYPRKKNYFGKPC